MNLKSWTLTDRQLCDIELILNGSFYPLDRFMKKDEYESVIKNMRLLDGSLFPIPIVLDVGEKFAGELSSGEQIVLRSKEGFQIANLNVEDIWKPDLQKEAKLVYGTNDPLHPAVDYLNNRSNKIYLAGKIEKISIPSHYDFAQYRLSPDEAKRKFKELGWDRIVAFQTRNPLHRAHVEMTVSSMKKLDARLFLHPVVGLTKAGDVDYYTRVRCYQHVLKKYPKNSVILGLLPLAMRMGGPREALLHAIVRKNYGCTHIIIGRDHAGPGNNSKGTSFYGPYEAQEIMVKYQKEIGIKMVSFDFMVYVPKLKKYKSLKGLGNDTPYRTISGTQLRNKLNKGESIPDWFSYPEVSRELEKTTPPQHKKGFTVFFTGLSGSGKSTIANGLLIKLLEQGNRSVTLLDGDIVRTHLSSELGFSKEHRSLNVRRIGYVASEITKSRGIALCAPIAPYAKDREINRSLISKYGGYFEVFVNTPLEKCEERDSKGLYKLARLGKIKKFTGISDPYEIPTSPDITLLSDGSLSPADLVNVIYENLIKSGYICL